MKLEYGKIFKVVGEKTKYAVVSESEVNAEVYAEPDKPKQKTYMLKANCPSCGRIIRLTGSNWDQTPIRQAIMCVHADGTGNEFVLESDNIIE